MDSDRARLLSTAWGSSCEITLYVLQTVKKHYITTDREAALRTVRDEGSCKTESDVPSLTQSDFPPLSLQSRIDPPSKLER